jgi:hypothetical protein
MESSTEVLLRVLNSEELFYSFREYLEAQKSAEILFFWKSVQKFKIRFELMLRSELRARECNREFFDQSKSLSTSPVENKDATINSDESNLKKSQELEKIEKEREDLMKLQEGKNISEIVPYDAEIYSAHMDPKSKFKIHLPGMVLKPQISFFYTFSIHSQKTFVLSTFLSFS